MSIRLSFLVLVSTAALVACSTPKSPVDPAGNAWVTEQPAKPASQQPMRGAFGGGGPAKPATAPASRAAPAR